MRISDWSSDVCSSDLSRLLKRALQRMLILAGEVHHLIDLCLGDFVAEYPAFTHAPLMDVKHDAGRLFNVHLEKELQDEVNDLHRSIIVVQHQYLIRRRLFGARASTDRKRTRMNSSK